MCAFICAQMFRGIMMYTYNCVIKNHVLRDSCVFFALSYSVRFSNERKFATYRQCQMQNLPLPQPLGLVRAANYPTNSTLPFSDMFRFAERIADFVRMGASASVCVCANGFARYVQKIELATHMPVHIAADDRHRCCRRHRRPCRARHRRNATTRHK